ncbi:hypothetical protein EDC04DRAFT_1813206 [Pisolithus marmoratus]|nr:hypothetical protein EDC04DRAFT_1813206 [Pisolithus marmoratus]
MSPLSSEPLARPSAGSHSVFPHYLATSSTLSNTVLTPTSTAVCGTSAGLLVAVVALLSWKWRCWDQAQSLDQKSKTAPLLRRRWRRPRAATRPRPIHASPFLQTWLLRAREQMWQRQFIQPRLSNQDPPPSKSCHRDQSEMQLALESRAPSAFHPHRGLSYKASTITSSSVYSTQSGEEHQVRVPPSVVVAALGPYLDQGFSADDQGLALLPRAARRTSQLVAISKTPDEAGASLQMNRLSHLSAESLSLNMQLVDPALMTLPIGLAYGGE